MYSLPKLSGSFSEGKFWLVYGFSVSLLLLDCLTTVIILEVCGGVELNPLVNRMGLFNITIYKLVANAFVGLVCLKKQVLWLLYVVSSVFVFVVLWNMVNIFLCLS
jgi:hypothetical protein